MGMAWSQNHPKPQNTLKSILGFYYTGPIQNDVMDFDRFWENTIFTIFGVFWFFGSRRHRDF